MQRYTLFFAFFMIGVEHISPWDGSSVPVAKTLPKMERVDPYDGAPIIVNAPSPLQLDRGAPWNDSASDISL